MSGGTACKVGLCWGPDIHHVQAKRDIAASFQRVAVQHLTDKTARAARWAMAAHPSITTLVVSGEGLLDHTSQALVAPLMLGPRGFEATHAAARPEPFIDILAVLGERHLGSHALVAALKLHVSAWSGGSARPTLEPHFPVNQSHMKQIAIDFLQQGGCMAKNMAEQQRVCARLLAR